MRAVTFRKAAPPPASFALRDHGTPSSRCEASGGERLFQVLAQEAQDGAAEDDFGGVTAGGVLGATDEFGCNVVSDGVHAHDFHATLLHLLGIDHERLTYRFTDVEGRVVKGVLA